MAKKYKPTEAELVNDPSLKYHPDYKWGEALECDFFEERVRFLERLKSGRIKLASLVLAPLPNTFDPLCVRRPVFKFSPMTQEEKEATAAGAHAYYGSRHNKGGG